MHPALQSDTPVYDALSRQDPTRTRTVRREYAQRLRGAYSRINTVIREYVEQEDIFGLRNDALVTPPGDFSFDTDDSKIEGFESWLQQAQQDEVLEVIERNDNRFIKNAYHRGLENAKSDLEAAGLDADIEAAEEAFNLPIHEDKVQQLYTRNFSELEGITHEVDRQVSRALSDGLSQGKNPRDIARDITDRVDSIGKTRASTLARTEIIHAHSESQLTRYERMGVDTVTIRAEFMTAQDDNVCPLCSNIEGETVSIEEARSETFQYQAGENEPDSLSGEYPVNPPIHPNCRCRWIPQISD